MNKNLSLKISKGFTIVELLVVIVVIGILASITIVSYTGITQKAVVSTIKSDLANNSQKLKMYYTLYGSYPTALDGSNCPSAPTADTKYCLTKSNSSSTLNYSSVAPSTFRLSISDATNNYYQTDNSMPSIAKTADGATTGEPCPTNYVPVPGSGTYGTNDFCVMKYEAKILGNDVGNQTYSAAFVPDSREAGTPWVNISQTDAITESATACAGCHLITEPEWMTIAQNVLSVNSNWSGGVVGSGCIFRGNVNINDACSYNGADPEGGTGRNAKASLTLTNGEIIWDMAGNVYDWTSGTIAGNQQLGLISDSTYTWKQYNDTSLLQNGYPSIALPSYTGIAGSSSWGSSQGVGQILTNYSESNLMAIRRGVAWDGGSTAGIYGATTGNPATHYSVHIGFRVSK